MPLKASLAQVKASTKGRFVAIDSDVMDVAIRIREVDPCLSVDYGEDAGLFRIRELCADGRYRNVCWVRELTPDLPDYLQRILKTDYVKDMERRDAQAQRDSDHRIHEIVGPIGERLAHAVRKDLGVKSRAFVPKGI
jgi:hypothetical protein